MAYHGLLGFREGMPAGREPDDGFGKDDTGGRDCSEKGMDGYRL